MEFVGKTHEGVRGARDGWGGTCVEAWFDDRKFDAFESVTAFEPEGLICVGIGEVDGAYCGKVEVKRPQKTVEKIQ
ncbi:hypothetical protein HK097_002113 [Rhizophlyctis rosea]|uniref:Uncharacterized protein n=1 Tax=Rhizophlyctis rosea TaxID=64517 RepID=A0AAD5X1F8_9FUNG|nr:hypothetical protein HK097_002113 [Rhizophlyctis rosea]